MSPMAPGRSIQDLYCERNARPAPSALGKGPQRSQTLQEQVVTAARDAASPFPLQCTKALLDADQGGQSGVHEAGMPWSSRSTGAEHSPSVRYHCLEKSTTLADSYIATDIAYQHNAGLTVSATGVAMDSHFPVDIGACFRQRQLFILRQ